MANKAELQSQSIGVQKALWEPVVGANGLHSRVAQARKGFLPEGVTLADMNGSYDKYHDVLGELAPRVVIASTPEDPEVLDPEATTIAGGWCALRTSDVEGIQRGEIMDPATGVVEKIQSPDQVADWITRSPSFDQVVEAIGPARGAEYVAISEQRLWTGRVVDKLKRNFDRRLTPGEEEKIADAMAQAERIRAEMTARYIRLASGDPRAIFTRVVDDDIWEELKRAQRELFARVGISKEQLAQRYPREAQTVKSSALVWTMYSEPYFDALRCKGYVTQPSTLIVEPTIHTYAGNEAGDDFMKRMTHEKGKYHSDGGINSNTGFVAYMECVTPQGTNVRKNVMVGEVPNISNWQAILATGGTLDPEKNAAIDPKQNNLYVWGVNLLPFGKTRENLIKLGNIQTEFQLEKARMGQVSAEFSKRRAMKDPTVDDDIRSMKERSQAVKDEFTARVIEQNAQVAAGLRELFGYLTEDLPK